LLKQEAWRVYVNPYTQAVPTQRVLNLQNIGWVRTEPPETWCPQMPRSAHQWALAFERRNARLRALTQALWRRLPQDLIWNLVHAMHELLPLGYADNPPETRT
jgi:hypothetical protein